MDLAVALLWRPLLESCVPAPFIGGGYLVGLRLSDDSRSAASTSYAPFARAGIAGRGGPAGFRIRWSLPLDLIPYRNGFSLRAFPEFVFDVSRFSLVLQQRSTLLIATGMPWSPDSVEFRWDTYAGIGFRL